MNKLLAYLFILFSSVSYGHEYYFGFAEVEYNEISQKFEMTLVMSTHDMERAFREELEMDTELSRMSSSSAEAERIENYICSHFVATNPAPIPLRLLGFESMPNGITHFYLESDTVEFTAEIKWKFDLLMNHFPEQQNKLTFYFRDQQHTLNFLPATHSQTLKLETNGL